MATDTQGRFRSALGEEREATRGATRELRAFDPREYAQESARAMFGQFREQLGEDFESMRGRQVKAGRLRSGLGMEDQDRFMRDRLDRLDRALATRSQTAAGQELQKQGLLGQFRGRYMDALSGQLDRETAEENARRARMSALLGGIFGIGGRAVAAANPFGGEEAA